MATQAPKATKKCDKHSGLSVWIGLAAMESQRWPLPKI